jgi:hypothetical protein
MDAKCIEFELTEASCNAISPGLYVGYFLFAIAVIAMVVLPLMNTIKNPGVLVKSGIGIGALVVLFAISYVMADSNVSPIAKSLGETESSVKLIGAGLIMLYITFFLSIIGLVYSEVTKVLK